ncbi:MAG: deoxyribose-phosphate aldolase [Clostridia bacterium]|nr:deoxyribose-phosphate aldolase [Clostridia bacterium]
MKLNKYIDHTLLKSDATTEQIKKICDEARQYDFASVCVNSCHVPLAKAELEGTDVKVCCVVGFPLGACFTEAKAYEAALSVERGAEEVDMVINIGAAKEGNWGLVEQDIKAVADACHPKAILKVIIETCLLTDEEKRKACLCAKWAGADFVKTSTGFSTSGATPEDVALMRETVGPHMGVKAAGGVRCTEDADKMISSGATRLGTSSGVKLMN